MQEIFQIYFMVRLKDLSLNEKELKFQPDFWAEVKYYLVGPKIILMSLYSLFFQTDNSLFPPLH